ncbi:TetR/AcrR family transcriptional regulator [Microbacterium sp. G2-8]|uniref:TetR/AcrR family transcriptional regulator n=1 Tax=Microbacterium sp. G2-8 TaxID=2842454 RepID=UPI0021AAF7A3|nr:TetR family transcriptional regulator [Microbacterium sp. G2-8]
MPRRVDHAERRQQIATALLHVVARDGVDAVSLRHVAAEAGVTAGMVQHYFPSKDAMMMFAMSAAAERYEERISGSIASLGEDPAPADIIRTLLRGLLPADEEQVEDARVALGFQTYATTHGDAAADLRSANTRLTDYLATLLGLTRTANAHASATALLAAAEGLSLHMLSSGLPLADAEQALDAAIAAFETS